MYRTIEIFDRLEGGKLGSFHTFVKLHFLRTRRARGQSVQSGVGRVQTLLRANFRDAQQYERVTSVYSPTPRRDNLFVRHDYIMWLP